jgi:tRNA/rRNA methyltransferase
MRLENIRVVLVQPEEAGNVGAAARVLKNFGLTHLVLVSPRLARPEETYKWAHGAEEVVEGADIVSNLGEAVGPCARAWATTRRHGKHRGRSVPPREAAVAMQEMALSGQPSAWIFGPESRGLNSEEIALCSDRVSIPTSPDQPSLNLAQAVAVCCYETFLAGKPESSSVPALEAPLEDQAALYSHLEEALLGIGFLLPHTAATRMTALRRMVERARPTPSEVRLLRGMARQVQWAGAKAAERTDLSDEDEAERD